MEKWPITEAQQLRAISLRCITQHDCQGSRFVDMRENCGACTLLGYHSSADRRSRDFDGRPNHAGWLRTYIQIGRGTKSAYVARELEDAKAGHDYGDWQSTPNPHYYNAILRDVVTFGCPNARQRTHDAATYDAATCPLCAAVAAGPLALPAETV